MKISCLALALLTCCAFSDCLAGTAPHGADSTKPAPAVAPDKMWERYAQLFARDLSGPERAAERVVAFAQVMTNHPPLALIRLSPVQRPGPSASGRLQGIRLPEGSVSMGAFLVQVVRYAWELGPQFPQNRIRIPDALASRRYDYIDTMPQGGPAVLRQALQEQFGLVARRQVLPGADGQPVESLIVETHPEP